MNLEEKLMIFKEKGWTCNPKTGDVFSHTGNIVNGSLYKNGYIMLSLRLKDETIRVYKHQLCYYLETGLYTNKDENIDHIDRNRINNKINNLRIITQEQNNFNNSSTGVNWCDNRKKWRARLRCNNIEVLSKRFDNYDEAVAAHKEAKEKYHIID